MVGPCRRNNSRNVIEKFGVSRVRFIIRFINPTIGPSCSSAYLLALHLDGCVHYWKCNMRRAATRVGGGRSSINSTAGRLLNEKFRLRL